MRRIAPITAASRPPGPAAPVRGNRPTVRPPPSVHTVASLQVDMAAGMRAGIAEWAQIPAPTPAPAPHVIPPGGTPRRWDFWCKHRRLDWMPGDTIQAGLELHVVIEVDADPGDSHELGAGGPPCFYDTWQHGGVLVPVLTGIIHVSPARFRRDVRGQSHVGWRWIAMHELGHIVGVANWAANLVEVVVARHDVMNWSGDFRTEVITDLSLSALFPGFKAEPQGHTLPTDAWQYMPGTQMKGMGVVDFRYTSP